MKPIEMQGFGIRQHGFVVTRNWCGIVKDSSSEYQLRRIRQRNVCNARAAGDDEEHLELLVLLRVGAPQFPKPSISRLSLRLPPVANVQSTKTRRIVSRHGTFGR